MVRMMIAVVTLFAVAAVSAEPEAGIEQVEVNGHTVSIQADVSPKKILSAVSPVYPVEGVSKSEIIQRAQVCVPKHVSFAPVAASGGTGSLFGTGDLGITTSTTIGAGALIELVDADAGILIANSRVNFVGALILQFVVQSRMQIEARDGRFRITTSDMQELQKSTGSASNDGFQPLIAVGGTGWKKSIGYAVSAVDKVAACMSSAPANDDW